MKKTAIPFFCQTTLAASLLLAFGGACAQEAAPSPDDIRKDLYTPDSRVSVGLGYQSSDNRRFGHYRSLTDEGAYGLLDLDLVKRDDSTGTWLKLKGKSLGLDGRELRVDHERQGDWSYFIQGTQQSRSEPLVVTTGLQGIGSARETVSNAAALKRNVDLKVDHDIYALGVRKFVTGGLDVRVTFKQDEKKGDRMFGRGFAGATSLMEFLTEPIDHMTRQWEVVAGYADRKLQLSGGYSGSSYDNNMAVLRVAGGSASFGLPLTNPAMTAFALPPSNSAHQLHLAGGYNWSDSTRSSFKLSRSVAYQNETFDPVFNAVRLAGAPNSLDGKVATTLAFADLTMRPTERLDVTGVLRYEDRDDQTPEQKYLNVSPAATTTSAGITGFNKPRQLKQLKGTVEAGYRLDAGYRLVGSLEQEDTTRNGSRDKIRIAYRENTSETTARLELKRTMSETLNGGVALLHSDRAGSDYVRDTYTAPETSNRLAALMWADRSRDKLRLTADWVPADAWSLQLLADVSDDSYSGRTLGPRKGSAQFVSGDVSYRINDKWNLSTWLSQEKIAAKQSSSVNPTATTSVLWDADLRDTTTAWGISLKGKPRANLELGADLSSSLDVAESGMTRTGGTGVGVPAVTSLPDYYYRQLSLKLFADYALDRQSGIRVDLVVDRRNNSDWTWQNWTYSAASDGTTVTNVASENTAFIGVSYHYRWR
jgi:MtrB/PioB family decaheme-associated outer membrane protein